MKKNLHLLIDSRKIMFATQKIHVLSNFNRIEIIDLILQNQALNVTQIHTQLNFRQTDTSQHLQVMHRYGFLNRERKGHKVFYSVDKKAVEEIVKISDDLYLSK
jgi:predicted transcriptional regulator